MINIRIIYPYILKLKTLISRFSEVSSYQFNRKLVFIINMRVNNSIIKYHREKFKSSDFRREKVELVSMIRLGSPSHSLGQGLRCRYPPGELSDGILRKVE